ncbi:MAG: hypothetical protein EP308_05615 [Burkholderiales bacterium]|nr:MAG: hypothetical protein EP308_05615 [Burkholderiales bacterium]
MSLFKTLLVTAALVSMAACSSNTVQGVKQDAQVVKEKAVEVKDKVVDTAIDIKDKAVEGGKAAGQAVGSGLERAGGAVKGATN